MPDRKRARWILALIIFVAFIVYLLGNGRASLVDRDEPRYAQTSRQMLQSGDWIVPRLYDQPRTAKPVGIYWFQAATMKVLGDTVFAARFPSAVAMPVTLAIIAFCVWRWAGPCRAVWTVFVLATSVLAIVVAKVCLTDSVLLVWTTLAQGCLYLAWRGRGTWPVMILMGVAIGLAGLTKGPVVLGVMAMTLFILWGLRGLDAILLKRRVKERATFETKAGDVLAYEPSTQWETPTKTSEPADPVLNVGGSIVKGGVVFFIVAAIVGPWIYLVHVRAPTFIETSLGHDVINRMSSGLEGHSGPPGYHLATIWGTYLPWSILLPMTIVFAFKRRHIPQIRFALAAVIGPWIMLEIVRTKLPHYMLPVFPFLAFLTADAIVRCLRGQHADLVRPQFISAMVIMGVVIAIGGTLPWWLLAHYHTPAWPGIVVFAVAIIVMGIAVSLFMKRKPANGLIALGAGSFVLFLIFWTVYLPNADPLRLSIRVADILKAHGVTGPHQVVMLDYKEPSLAFYQGGTIRENSALAISDELLDESPPWLVITKEVWDNPKTAVSARDRLDVIATLRGLAYADTGRTVDVMVVQKKK